MTDFPAGQGLARQTAGDAVPGRAAARQRGLRLTQTIFLALFLAAGLPIAVLTFWQGRIAYQTELATTQERNLLAARDLAADIARYTANLEAAFGLAFANGSVDRPVPGVADLLGSLDVTHVWQIGPDGRLETSMPSLSTEAAEPPAGDSLDDLRRLAANAHGQAVLANLRHNLASHPVLYLVRALPGNRLGIALVSTNYLATLQQTASFGDVGGTVIADAKGQAVAHPLRDYTDTARDISTAPAVAAALRGEAGAGIFPSRAFKGDIVAGYASVPETGWVTIVEQPVSDLKSHVDRMYRFAGWVALATLIGVGLLTVRLARASAQPIKAIAAVADAIAGGDDEAVALPFRGRVPLDVRQMRASFNTMLDTMRWQRVDERRTLRQLESANTAKALFLANMSQEIRTPLDGLAGTIELLRSTQLTQAQTRYVDTAAQSGKALLRLMDDVLDLSRIETGHLELQRAPFHLPSVIHDIRGMFGDQARAKGLTLWTSVPEELNVMLIGDRNRLFQIMANLIGNALRFTAEGHITLRGYILGREESALRLRFEVSDSGIGIPASAQDSIFDAFVRGGRSASNRQGGTGLGLAVCRQLCHMMGGEIGVESVPGKGSTFLFTVVMNQQTEGTTAASDVRLTARAQPELPPPPRPEPLAVSRPPLPQQPQPQQSQPQQPQPQQPQPQQPPRQDRAVSRTSAFATPPTRPRTEEEPPIIVSRPVRPAQAPTATQRQPDPAAISPVAREFRAALARTGRTTVSVMVVEDNAANMRVTQALLETLGIQVTMARNGLEAIAAYREKNFDLILMDCQMPEMDGYEATRAIRQLERFQGHRTPVVALTAHAMEGSREASLESGMDDQITKPLTMAILIDKLREWLIPVASTTR